MKIKITEQTIRELNLAIKEGKKLKKDKVIVLSACSKKDEFEIYIELKPNTQESLGYRIDEK